MNQSLTLQEAIDLLPDGVILVDEEGNILASNPQVLSIFGYQPDELKGQPVDLLIPARYRQNHQQHVRHFFAKPSKRRMGVGLKLSGIKKDGVEIDVDIALAPVTLGQHSWVMAIIRDISDLKNLERNLLKKNEELSLSNTQLERLGHVIAHDLKSPLLNLQALVHLLEREISDGKTENFATYGKALNDVLASMLNLISGITRNSESGAFDPDHEAIDLNSVLDEVKKLVQFAQGFSLSVPVKLPVIHGNKTKVLQVFLNLLNNAIKYNDKQAGEIEIRAYHNPRTCLISITDNGPGVPTELRQQIFEMYQKGTIEKEDSQGIGLAVVKKIIEDHGGGILVDTSSLGGADFIFTWPAKPLKAAAQGPAHKA